MSNNLINEYIIRQEDLPNPTEEAKDDKQDKRLSQTGGQSKAAIHSKGYNKH